MNRVPILVRNPAYVGRLEPDEEGVDPADSTPSISGNDPVTTVPASDDEEAGAGYLEPDLTEFFPDVSVAETQSDKDPLPSDVSISSVLQRGWALLNSS